MPSPNWNRVREIFENCLAQPADKRESYLRRVCGENEEMLKEVQRLLGGDEAAQSEFLEWPRELSAQSLASCEESSGSSDEPNELPPIRSAAPNTVGGSKQMANPG